MAQIVLNTMLLYALMGISFLFLALAAMMGYMYMSLKKKDIVIFIDKSERWNLFYTKLAGKDDIDYGNKKYIILKDSVMLSKKGRGLAIFSENKPAPLMLKYDKAEWLTSESLQNIMNNKLIQQLVKTTSDVKDMIMLMGALGGMIAGIAAVVLLLKTYGILK